MASVRCLENMLIHVNLRMLPNTFFLGKSILKGSFSIWEDLALGLCSQLFHQ